nr:Biomphalaria glabrata uridine phosphorylase 1-like; transcript variant X2 [Biomphalaria glabrata]
MRVLLVPDGNRMCGAQSGQTEGAVATLYDVFLRKPKQNNMRYVIALGHFVSILQINRINKQHKLSLCQN